MKINEKRIIKNFIELAKISSPSGKEKKVAQFIIKKFSKFTRDIYIDNAGEKINGDTGNLIIKIKGNNSLKPFLLSAHMDTVGPFGKVSPKIKGDRIYSDGTTTLGADCKAGIAIILECVEKIFEEKISHPPLELVFTISEEMALAGSKNLDYSRIKARAGLIFDNEKSIENVILKAPAANSIDIKVYGKAAHSGVEPEKGISAIEIAAKAISLMKLGRIDAETTLNIGIISGGEGINIIPPSVFMKGEIRSHNPKKIERQKTILKNYLLKAIKGKSVKIHNETYKPSFEFISIPKFSNLNIDENHWLIKIIQQAMSEEGIEMKASISGGGTDANIFYQHNIITPIIATGMRNVHTTNEYLDLKDFFKSANIALKVIQKIKE